MRDCGNPLCIDQLDIGAVLAGAAPARGWVRNRLVEYLCQADATGDHVPDWDLYQRHGLDSAVPTCSCTWRGDPHPNRAGAIEQWSNHILEVECPPT